MGVEPANSLQAVIFAAMFSGVVSMAEDAILLEFGVSKKDLVDNFQMGTETALGRANIIRTTKLETLQAFIMYMVSDLDSDHDTSLSSQMSIAIVILSTHLFTCNPLNFLVLHNFILPMGSYYFLLSMVLYTQP